MVLGMGSLENCVVSNALLNVLIQQIRKLDCDCVLFHCSLFSAKAMQLMDQVDTGVNISLITSLLFLALCMTLYACCKCVITTVNAVLLLW